MAPKSGMITADQYSDGETASREDTALKRLLLTPPDDKAKPKGDASPKKRGRPKVP
jgi:hypothetical protein